VEEMSRILRNQFVNLHSEPLLENLRDNFAQRYPHNKFPEIPKRGDFDLEEVKKSPYFFA
jgi:DNA-directed RNA polymerase